MTVASTLELSIVRIGLETLPVVPEKEMQIDPDFGRRPTFAGTRLRPPNRPRRKHHTRQHPTPRLHTRETPRGARRRFLPTFAGTRRSRKETASSSPRATVQASRAWRSRDYPLPSLALYDVPRRPAPAWDTATSGGPLSKSSASTKILLIPKFKRTPAQGCTAPS